MLTEKIWSVFSGGAGSAGGPTRQTGGGEGASGYRGVLATGCVFPGDINVFSRETRDGPGREGQPPGSSTIAKLLTPAGVSVSSQPQGAGRHGYCLGEVIAVPVGLRVCRLFHHWVATRRYILQR